MILFWVVTKNNPNGGSVNGISRSRKYRWKVRGLLARLSLCLMLGGSGPLRTPGDKGVKYD